MESQRLSQYSSIFRFTRSKALLQRVMDRANFHPSFPLLIWINSAVRACPVIVERLWSAPFHHTEGGGDKRYVPVFHARRVLTTGTLTQIRFWNVKWGTTRRDERTLLVKHLQLWLQPRCYLLRMYSIWMRGSSGWNYVSRAESYTG